MATAMKKRVQKIQNAIRSTLEKLESRVHLAAGQLDNSWYDSAFINTAPTNANPGYIRETTQDSATVYAPFNPGSLPATTVPDNVGTIDLTNGIDNEIVKTLVDNAGKVYVIGYSTGLVGFSAPWTQQVDPTTTQAHMMYGSFKQRNLYIATYNPNGELESIATSVRDLGHYQFTNGPTATVTYAALGTFGGLGAAVGALTNQITSTDNTINASIRLNNDAITAAIDPTDGTIVVVFRTVNADTGDLAWYMARYSPVSNLARRCLSMTQIDFGLATATQGNVRNIDMQSDGSFVLVGDSTPYLDTTAGLQAVATRYDRAGAILSRLAIPAFTSYSADSFAAVAVDGRGTASTADDLIYTVGTTDDSTWDPASGVQRLVVQRYFSSGAVDAAFGFNVTAELADFGGKNVQGLDVRVQGDGKIVVLGDLDTNPTVAGVDTTVIARFNTGLNATGTDGTVAGTLDATFIGSGRAYIYPAAGNTFWLGEHLVIQTDGGIVVQGITNGNEVQATRLDKTGRPDLNWGFQSFGALPGIPVNVVDEGAYWNYYPITLAVDRGPNGSGDDKIYVSWTSADTTPGTNYFVVSRLLATNTAPIANLQAPDVYIAPTAANPYTFIVTYTDDEFVNVASLGTVGGTFAGLSIIRPDGSVLAVPVTIKSITRLTTPLRDRNVDGTLDAKSVSVTYTADVATALGGFPINPGLYTIKLADNTVSDCNYEMIGGVLTLTPAYIKGRTLGSFYVNITTPDLIAPVISFDYPVNVADPLGPTTNDIANGLTVRGRSYFDFHVVYSDSSGIDLTKLSSTNLLVTGPRGYSQFATLIGTPIQLDNSRRIMVTYRILAPNATAANDYAHPWNSTYNGQYNIFMQQFQIADLATVPNYIPAGNVGQLAVAIQDAHTVYPTVSNIVVTPDENIVLPGTQVQSSRATIGIQVTYSVSPWAFANDTIDATSLFGTAIRVTSTANGFNSLATMVGVPTTSDGGKTYVVTYRLSPADGSWDLADNATYVVSLEANAIRDTEVIPNFAQPAQLTTFDISIIAGQDARPTATVAPVATTVASRSSIAMTVTFSPSVFGHAPIDATSLFDSAILITGPGGFSLPATRYTTPVVANPDGSYTITYTITPADGSWDLPDNGTYTIALQPNTIKDTDTPANFALAANIGTFNVAIVAGQDAHPIATLTAIPQVNAVRGPIDFTVTYKPSTFAVGVGIVIDPTSDFATAITISNGSTFTHQAVLQSITGNPDGSYTVVYRTQTTDGTWSVSDDGTYTVALNSSNKIKDTQITSQFAAAQTLGSFLVNIGSPTATLAAVPTVVASRQFITFNVTFAPPASVGSTVVIDGTSTFATAIVVTGPGGFSQTATFVSTTNNGNGTYTVKYTISPADTSWDLADNGTYTASVAPGTVKDTDSPANFVPVGPIGTITVNIVAGQDARPSATLTPIPNIVAISGATQFVVTYAPSLFSGGAVVDGTSNFAGAVRVTGTNGFSAIATFVSRVAVAGGGYAVTYRIVPADANWDTTDNGTYTVSAIANTVKDTQPTPEFVKAGSLGTFVVNVIAPFATLTPIATIRTPQHSLNFTVTYYSSDGILLSSVQNNNNAVEVTGPNGYDVLATYVSATVLPDGSIQTVYQIIPPANAAGASAVWNAINSGLYTVSIAVGNGISSTLGQALPPGGLGTFTVNVSSGLYAGQLDLTWENDGYLTSGTTVAPVTGPIPFIPGITQESGGKLLFSATTNDVTSGGLSDYYYLRTQQDGTADTSLKWGNIHTTPSNQTYTSSDDEAVAVLMQSTGKFVVIGRTTLHLINGGVVTQALSLSRLYPTGGLDGTWANGNAAGNTSHAVTEWTGGTASYENFGLTGVTVHDAYVQADDKIVVVMSQNFAQTGTDWVIVRINADGTMDTAFGTNGVVHITPAANASPNAAFASYATDEPLTVTEQPDGKILVGGYSDTRTFDQYTGYRKFVVVRLTTTGAFDSTFNGTGIVEVGDFGHTDAACEDLAVQQDGKILAVGYGNNKGALVRFNSNGTVDGTFGNRGLVQIDGTYVPAKGASPTNTVGARFGYGVDLQDSGQIIVTSRNTTQNEVFSNRYFANGTPDSQYGINGRGTTNPADLGGFNILGFRSLMQSDGKLEVVGTRGGPGTFELATARFLGDNYPPQAVLQAQNITTEIPTYTFTVTYTDNFLVDATTLDINDLYVVGPDGTHYAVTAAVPSTGTDSKTIVVTYTLAAPGGTWDDTDNGAYQVWQAANQVYDIDGQLALAAPARNLGAFIVHINPAGVVSPTAVLEPNPGQVAFGSTFLDLVVTYTDDQSVSFATVNANNIRVTGPDFYLADNSITAGSIVLVSLKRLDGTPATANERVLQATYRIFAPQGTWGFGDNGTYYVYLKPNQVSDADPVPNYAAGSLTQPIGNVQVAVFTDLVPPTAEIDLPDTAVAGGTSYTFTVTYKDNGAVAVGSLDDNDIRVTGPNGYDMRAHFVSAAPSMDNATILATYRIIPPGGTWDISDAGTYHFYLNSGQVSDTAGVPNYAVAGELGALVVANLVDTESPTATAAPVADVLAIQPTVTVVVTFTDNAAVDVSTINASNIFLQRESDGNILNATSVTVDLSTSGTPRTATYVFTGAAGDWVFGDNGTYQIQLAAGVTDTAGNPIDPATLGSFDVTIQQDLQNPTVALVSAPNITTLGGTTYDFVVRFSDDVAVQLATLGAGDFVVDTPMPGVSLPATLLNVSLNSNGTPMTATYRITPPGGAWQATQSGTYSIRMVANQVFDTSNKPVAAGVIGTFVFVNNAPTVELPSPIVPALPGATTIAITVLYRDDYAIDATTIAANNLIVTRPSDGLVLDPVGVPTVNLPGNGTPRSVTYTFSAPGGTWNYVDDGDYVVSMRASSVKDIGGKAVAAGQIGQFTFLDKAPTVSAVVTPIAAPTINPITVTFTLTDDQGIDVTTLSAINFSLARTDNAPIIQLVQVPGSFVATAAGTTATVTVQFTAPGGFWDWTDNGFYTPAMAPGATDLGGQLAVTTPPLAPYRLALATDLVPPTAVATTTPTINSTGFNTYVFGVTYTDNVAVDVATIATGNITVISPAGDHYAATLVANSVSSLTSTGTITALYRIDRGSDFTYEDDGQWQIYLNSHAVADVSGNFAGEGSIGVFTVQVPDVSPPTAELKAPLPTPVELATTVQVTVIYQDSSGVDLTTIDGNDISVTSFGGTALTSAGAPSYVVTAGPSATVEVTYTFNAPGGTWNFQDVGTYTVRLLAGQVRDISGNGVAAQNLGTFDYTDAPPQAAFVPPSPVITVGPNNVTIVVDYTDEAQLDATTFDGNDISVLRTSPGPLRNLVSAGAPTVTMTDTVGRAYRVTYTFLAPGGYWESSDNGTYAIQLVAGQVTDLGGNPCLGPTLASFDVGFDSDTTAPDATLTNAIQISSPVTTYDFTIRYQDDTAVDYQSIGAGDVLVTGPGGAVYAASLVSRTPNAYSQTVDAVYRITRATGFDASVNGTYSVRSVGNQVADVSGNFIGDDIEIGTFLVNCPVPAVTAQLGSVSTAVQGMTTVTFFVTYNSSTYLLDAASISGNSSAVLVTGPNGFSQLATFKSINDSSNGLSRIASYEVTAPGGSWDFASNGTYTISMVPNNGIVNTVGGTVAAGQLGTFLVSLRPGFLVGSTLRVDGTNASDSIELVFVPGTNPNLDQINVLINNVSQKFSRTAVSAIEINGLDGNDTIKVGAGLIGALVHGGLGNDTIYGGSANDTLFGDEGNDYIFGQGGADILYGGAGRDTLVGGVGADVLYGGSGNDSLAGGAGADVLYGNAGRDTLSGGGGPDVFYTRDGSADVIIGGAGTNSAQVDALDSFSSSDIQNLLA